MRQGHIQPSGCAAGVRSLRLFHGAGHSFDRTAIETRRTPVVSPDSSIISCRRRRNGASGTHRSVAVDYVVAYAARNRLWPARANRQPGAAREAFRADMIEFGARRWRSSR